MALAGLETSGFRAGLCFSEYIRIFKQLGRVKEGNASRKWRSAA